MTPDKAPTPTLESATDPDPAGTPERRIGRSIVVSVVVVFLIVLMSSAIKNTLTANLIPMGNSFNVSRGRFAVAPTIFMLTYAVMSPVVGVAADRFGGRRTMLGGLSLGATMFVLSGLTHNFFLFIVLYGVGLAVAYTAVSYVPLGVLVNELFTDGRRGIMYALLTNGTAVGFIVLSPLWINLSTSHSWRSVYLWLGAAFVVLLVLAVTVLPRQPGPDDAAGPAPAVAPLGARLKTVLGNKRFWIIAGPFFACGTSMAFIDVDMVADMGDMHMSTGLIGTAVALLGAAEIAGGMLAGYLADHNRKRSVLIVSYIVRFTALVVLLVFPDIAGSVSFALLFGFSYMGTVIASSVYLMEIFDDSVRGLALGMMWLVHQAGAAVSSLGGAIVYDDFRSYNVAIASIAGSVALAVLAAALFAPRPAIAA